LVLELGAGLTPVAVRLGPDGALTAELTAPQLPRLGESPIDAERLAALVGLAADDLDPSLPLHLADAGGTTFVVSGVRGLDALGRSRPNGTAPGVVGIYLSTRNGSGWQSRMFAEDAGVPEDPATGSATVAFAGSLHRHVAEHSADGTHRVDVRQGVEMGRPSDLALAFDVRAGAITEVRLRGAASKVLEGHLTAGG
jgi:trans-2,3-dihydro-3-hydroxyanthranilate isomerase